MVFAPRKIWQFSIDGRFIREYNSLGDAKRKYSIEGSILVRALKKGHQCKGYYWQYAQGSRPLHITVRKYRAGKEIRVYHWGENATIDFYNEIKNTSGCKGELFIKCVSIKEAVECTNISQANILKCCLGKISHYGKYTYEMSDISLLHVRNAVSKNKASSKSRRLKIINTVTKDIFISRSMNEALKKFSLSKQKVYEALRGGKKYVGIYEIQDLESCYINEKETRTNE